MHTNEPTEQTGHGQLLTVADVARFLNTTERMARRIFDERRVPVVKVGRHVRIRPEDLDAYLSANTSGGAL